MPAIARESLALRARKGDSLEVLVTRHGVEMFCLGETVAVPLFKVLREGCVEPTARKALDRVLKDEVRHRDFGWALLEYLVELPCADELRAQVVSELPDMFRRLRSSYAPVGGETRTAIPQDDRAWGLMPIARYRAILDRTGPWSYHERKDIRSEFVTLRLIPALTTCDPSRPIGVWLWTVFLNFVRECHHERVRAHERQALLSEMSAGETDALEDPILSADELATARREVGPALDEMPEDEARRLRLCFGNGAGSGSTSAVARSLEIGRYSTERLLSRALGHLVKLLGERKVLSEASVEAARSLFSFELPPEIVARRMGRDEAEVRELIEGVLRRVGTLRFLS